ncbi:MAG: prolipoprotein diacylglyceryl transferase [Cyclobacteriaceae bacterium]
MLSYIIWNANPEIFSIGSFSLRWYGLFFALGFLLSQQILYYIYRKEGKPEKDIDTLTIYMVLATIVGARLGHIFFYQPELLWENPLGVFLPFEFTPEFRFTGLQGLASHGAAIGILFALWLYSRKKKVGQNYLQVLDRIVIVVALTGCLIRFGNFFNSEIIGKPTDSGLGVVFVGRVEEALMRNDLGQNPVESISIVKDKELPEGMNGRVPINIFLFFKEGTEQETAQQFCETNTKYFLTRLYEFVDEPPRTDLQFELYQEKTGTLVAKVNTFGISRHAAQLYESISCLLLFAFLFWIWNREKEKIATGKIFGLFMVILWTLRFIYEFLKENQVAFEDNLTLNMGQILSIPMVIVGIGVLIWSKRNATKT